MGFIHQEGSGQVRQMADFTLKLRDVGDEGSVSIEFEFDPELKTGDQARTTAEKLGCYLLQCLQDLSDETHTEH